MKKESDRFGEVFYDHSFSPGISIEEQLKAGVKNPVELKGQVRLPTLTCCHCATAFVKNPNRDRDRGRCWKCNWYLCDPCSAAQKAGIECVNKKARADVLVGSDKPLTAKLQENLILRSLINNG